MLLGSGRIEQEFNGQLLRLRAPRRSAHQALLFRSHSFGGDGNGAAVWVLDVDVATITSTDDPTRAACGNPPTKRIEGME